MNTTSNRETGSSVRLNNYFRSISSQRNHVFPCKKFLGHPAPMGETPETTSENMTTFRSDYATILKMLYARVYAHTDRVSVSVSTLLHLFVPGLASRSHTPSRQPDYLREILSATGARLLSGFVVRVAVAAFMIVFTAVGEVTYSGGNGNSYCCWCCCRMGKT